MGVVELHCRVSEQRGQDAAASMLRLLAALLSDDHLRGATVFAAELAAEFACERVSIGFIEDGLCHLEVASDRAEADVAGDDRRYIEAAMDEAVEQTATLSAPHMADSQPHILLAHDELAHRLSASVCTVPLISGRRAVGAVQLLRRGEDTFGPDDVAYLEHLAGLAAPLLELKRDHAQPFRRRIARATREQWQRVFSRDDPSARRGLIIAAIAVLLVAAVPFEQHVRAPARIEGAEQRALVAPADGYLKQVHFRPGQPVKSGDIAVELADQELRIERAKWSSELAQHENAYAAALARSDRALFAINHARAAEARAQLALVDEKLTRAKVAVPLDGIVVKGDLSQSLGAPVRRGDVLMTVAPSDRFRVVVEVDDQDIAEIVIGQAGVVTASALPGNALPIRVERVSPVAVSADGRSYYEVEAEIEGSDRSLRPGMLGVAKLQAGRAPLVWQWTRGLVNWVRLKWLF